MMLLTSKYGISNELDKFLIFCSSSDLRVCRLAFDFIFEPEINCGFVVKFLVYLQSIDF